MCCTEDRSDDEIAAANTWWRDAEVSSWPSRVMTALFVLLSELWVLLVILRTSMLIIGAIVLPAKSLSLDALI